MNRQQLIDNLSSTGYGDGAFFESAGEVKEYFTEESFYYMFGKTHYTADDYEFMADYVIENRLHCDFPLDEDQITLDW